MISAEELVNRSRYLIEERIPRIDGLDYREYAGLLIFCDAFSDVLIHEHPELADKIQRPGKDLLQTVPEFLDSRDLDVMDYLDFELVDDLIGAIEKKWEGKLTVTDLIRFDRDSLGDLILIALGHREDVDNRVKKFLSNYDLEIPKDLGVDWDHRRYRKAYRALQDIGVIRESRSIKQYLDRAKSELERAQSLSDSSTRRKLQEILYDLEAVGHE